MEVNESKDDTSKPAVFKCTKCGLEEHYTYKGREPPFAKKIRILEEGYIIRDPFSPPNQKQFLLLGSDCKICNNMICQSSECSIFYTKRFCRSCAEQNIHFFPDEVQAKIKKNFKLT